jgi:hypothetical protein
MIDELEHSGNMEDADEVMDRPEVEQVLPRLRRIETMKDMGCPQRVMQTEYRLLGRKRLLRAGG